MENFGSSERAQPFLMHINPDRVSGGGPRRFARLESDGVEGLVNPAMVSGILQASMDGGDDSAFASYIHGRARVTAGVFGRNDDVIADSELAAH